MGLFQYQRTIVSCCFKTILLYEEIKLMVMRNYKEIITIEPAKRGGNQLLAACELLLVIFYLG